LCGCQILWSSCDRLGLFMFAWGLIALSILVSKWMMVQVLFVRGSEEKEISDNCVKACCHWCIVWLW
jgi:hypothetical protein